MRNAAKFACTLLVVGLTGCSSLNPFSSKSAPRNPPAELVDFKPGMNVRTAWSTSVGNAGSYTFSPSLLGDTIVTAAADGTVMRIEASTGRPLWRINAGLPLTAGIGSDGSTIVVAGEKGTVLAFDSDGKLRWKAQASSEILSAPAVGQGTVVVRSVDNRIIGLDVDSGVRRWVVQRSAPALTLRTAPGIVTLGPTAYVGLPGGRLLALALSNGGTRWEAAVGDPRGATELERVADISGTPIVLGHEICAVAYQGRVACFDAASGTPRWAKELSSEVGLGADERFVFVADEHGVLNAFTRASGGSVWRNNKLANRHLSAPISFGRAVAVGDGQGYVHFFSREEGNLLARVSTDGSPLLASPLVAGANLIMQTQSGAVVALTTD